MLEMNRLEILLQGCSRILPGISTVWHEFLKNRNNERLGLLPAVLNCACDTSNMSKGRPLCQKTRNLQVRINPFCHAPKEFENELLIKRNRGIALLAAHV